MKVHPECFECGARKTKERIDKSTKNEKIKMKCAKEFLRIMAENFREDSNPSNLGTLQVLMVKRITKCKDPFKKLKIIGREKIASIAKKFEKYLKRIKNEKRRFIEACRACTVANSTEIMAPYKEFKIKEINLKEPFGIDESEKLYNTIKKLKYGKILFLTDNYAEAVFDKILLQEIRKITNAKIVVGSSKEPIDDDLTLSDAKKIFKIRNISFVNTGNSFGIWWERAPKRILKEIKGANLIIAKGLANFETLTERKNVARKTFFLLTAKCAPIAREIKVKVGENAIFLFPPKS